MIRRIRRVFLWRRGHTKEADLLDIAWGVIANAGWNGEPKSPGWQEAAERWRDDYHAWLP